MFADVEFFGLAALVCVILGTLAIIAAKKLTKWN